MGQVVIEMGRAEFKGVGVIASTHAKTEELNSSTSSSATTIEAAKGDFATVINNDAEDIWVTFGASPVAAVGTGHFVPSGKIRDFGGLQAGEKAAVINDS